MTGLQNYVIGAYALLGNSVSGTYGVSSTGFGTLALTITASDGSGTMSNANYTVAVTSKGAATDRADNGMLASAQPKPQASTTFSNASANGSVVMQEQGYSGGDTFSLLSTLTLDGSGNINGMANYKTLGEITWQR